MNSTVTQQQTERGCGFRISGGIYLVLDTCKEQDDTCRPIMDYIVDPPRPLGNLPVSHIGSTLIDAKGINHVLDVVGSSHYPNVADFIQEAGRHGISRRISRTTRFDKITQGSRLILAHSRAIIRNYADYHKAVDRHLVCVTQRHFGNILAVEDGMCATYWWFDVTGGEVQGFDDDPYLVKRTIGGTHYWAHRAPDGVTPEYEIGVFASFPLSRIEVVRDQSQGTHMEHADLAAQSGLPVDIVDF